MNEVLALSGIDFHYKVTLPWSSDDRIGEEIRAPWKGRIFRKEG